VTARTYVVSTDQQIDRVAAFLRGLVRSHPVSLSVEKWRKQRTVTANARYWALTRLASEASGYTEQELHEQNCGDFFGWKAGELFGRPIRVPVRTTTTPETLDTKRFTEFMTWCEQRYIEHLDVWLPDR